jgi:hypothetical protein
VVECGGAGRVRVPLEALKGWSTRDNNRYMLIQWSFGSPDCCYIEMARQWSFNWFFLFKFSQYFLRVFTSSGLNYGRML